MAVTVTQPPNQPRVAGDVSRVRGERLEGGKGPVPAWRERGNVSLGPRMRYEAPGPHPLMQIVTIARGIQWLRS